MNTRRSPDERALRRTALRIGLQSGAGVAVTVLVLAAVAVLVVLRAQHAADDTLIGTAVTSADDVTDPPAGVWLVIQSGGTRAASPGLPAGLPDTGQLAAVAADREPRSTEETVGAREYRVDTRPYGTSGAIQAVLDLAANHAQRFQLLDALLITGAIGLLLAAGLGAWLARRAVAPMAQALALQRRFVADASHDLRTPLTLLSTRAQLISRSLARGADRAALKSDVDGLVRDARQLSATLDDLLIAVDPRSFDTAGLVDLTALVREAVDAVRPAAGEAGVSIDLSVAGAPVLAAAPDSGLRRALIALLDNAIRHAATAVRVVVGASGASVTVEVIDDGPGIDPDVLPTLFERFSGPTANGGEHGRRRHGLGLALVSEIAARCGGSVEPGIADGGGTRFRLSLPAAGRSRHQEFSQNGPAG